MVDKRHCCRLDRGWSCRWHVPLRECPAAGLATASGRPGSKRTSSSLPVVSSRNFVPLRGIGGFSSSSRSAPSRTIRRPKPSSPSPLANARLYRSRPTRLEGEIVVPAVVNKPAPPPSAFNGKLIVGKQTRSVLPYELEITREFDFAERWVSEKARKRVEAARPSPATTLKPNTAE